MSDFFPLPTGGGSLSTTRTVTTPADNSFSANLFGDLTGVRPTASTRTETVPTNSGEVFKQLFVMSPTEVTGIQQQMFRAGLYGKASAGQIAWGSAGDPATMTAFDKVLGYATNRAQLSGQNVDWRNALSDLVKFGAGGDGAGAIKPYKGPRTTTTTQTAKQTELSSDDDAFSALLKAMQDLLGRAPTSAEVSKFKGVLNAAERANPQVSTGTSTSVETPTAFSSAATGEVPIKSSVKTTSNSTTSGGVEAGAEAIKHVSADYGKEGAGMSIFKYAQAFEQLLRKG